MLDQFVSFFGTGEVGGNGRNRIVLFLAGLLLLGLLASFVLLVLVLLVFLALLLRCGFRLGQPGPLDHTSPPLAAPAIALLRNLCPHEAASPPLSFGLTCLLERFHGLLSQCQQAAVDELVFLQLASGGQNMNGHRMT